MSLFNRSLIPRQVIVILFLTRIIAVIYFKARFSQSFYLKSIKTLYDFMKLQKVAITEFCFKKVT